MRRHLQPSLLVPSEPRDGQPQPDHIKEKRLRWRGSSFLVMQTLWMCLLLVTVIGFQTIFLKREQTEEVTHEIHPDIHPVDRKSQSRLVSVRKQATVENDMAEGRERFRFKRKSDRRNRPGSLGACDRVNKKANHRVVDPKGCWYAVRDDPDNAIRFIQKKGSPGAPIKPPARARYESNPIAFIHIGKSGGTSFDRLGDTIAQQLHRQYYGWKHFGWSFVQHLQSLHGNHHHTHPQHQHLTGSDVNVDVDVDVVTILRNPIDRVVSHFHFARGLPWTRGHVIRSNSLEEFVTNPEKLVMLDTIFRSGSMHFLADVASLNRTARDYYADHFEEECVLAARRLNGTAWFGILEDLDRSMKLLGHVYRLPTVPRLPHRNKAKQNKNSSPTTWKVPSQDRRHSPKTDLSPYQETSSATRAILSLLIPGDVWLYEYAKLLFEARWQHYQTGVYVDPPYPRFIDQECVLRNRSLKCNTGPLAPLDVSY